jgi:hypothetical protein
MNEFFKYFQQKYSFTYEDLIQIYDKDFISFYESMKNKNLINSKNIPAMEREIDKFMEDMTYSNRKKRRG